MLCFVSPFSFRRFKFVGSQVRVGISSKFRQEVSCLDLGFFVASLFISRSLFPSSHFISFRLIRILVLDLNSGRLPLGIIRFLKRVQVGTRSEILRNAFLERVKCCIEF